MEGACVIVCVCVIVRERAKILCVFLAILLGDVQFTQVVK